MADTWISDITHFLDEDGEIVSEPSPAKALGEYFASIILMASYPDPEYPPEYMVKCRRRPNRKPCHMEIAAWIDPENGDIFWICPKCQDRGRINNWKGTMWDLSDSEQLVH